MISALMFCYNEVDKIWGCLASVRNWVDEIIVYDLESDDGTFEIIKEFTTDAYRVPYLLCGDGYKNELVSKSSGDWILWLYPDEVFPQKTAEVFGKAVKQDKYTSFSFMRHEYIDEIRVGYNKCGRLVYFGTPEDSNYQTRLHRKNKDIFYTEFVHAEIHGVHNDCGLPPEYYFEHRKTSQDQELDNIRLYIYYKYLVWKYGDTLIEPYKIYVDSYKKIIHDSEERNLKNDRGISLMEEFWWDWRKYADRPRVTLEEFQKIVGISYEEFLKKREMGEEKRIIIDNNVIDAALRDKK